MASSEGVSYCSSTTRLDHCQLIFDLRKFIEKWFILRRDSTDESPDVQEIFHQIKSSISCILLDDILLKDEKQQTTLLNELHWLHSCALRQEPSTSSANAEYLDFHDYNATKICSIYEWISACLKDSSLCSKLQLLVSDKELLHNYYNSKAFLRNEIYTTALFICISSIELNQSSLLSQIDNSIYNEKQIVLSKHRRSSSHPQFSISPKKYSLNTSKSTIISNKESARKDVDNALLKEYLHSSNTNNDTNSKEKCLQRSPINKNKNTFYIKLNRAWRSLPDLRRNNSSFRPRSKTISQPISIPNDKNNNDDNDWRRSKSNYVPGFFDFSKTHHSESTNSSVAATTSELNDLIPIQLVKCDDIKIYFDQSYNAQNSNNSDDKENYDGTSNSLRNDDNSSMICYDSPPQSKAGLSPINFLSCMSANLFTSSSDENLSTKDSNKLLFSASVMTPSSLPSTSNDFVSSFLPQQGEKLKARTHHIHNIFDDDFNDITSYDIIDYQQQQQQCGGQQSLAAFLQSAQFSRNNTDLERENAHFKISEAIIAIIEHMKWSKIERQLIQGSINNNETDIGHNNRNNNKTKRTIDDCPVRASSSSLTDKDNSSDSDDYNENEENHEDTTLCKETHIEENYGSVDDHTAYAEWGETNLDALSAEGVALSLISKFSDSQLPKASDLTWLVSEEDVPQELLPMPESPSANPDDYFIHSFTRGTRDWAPPRQQIIFTDHPPPNRKEHLQKQKYRCAGCGMKVALMYAHRFRYCTYLGKYLCSGCHRNQISTIPAKVLAKWDFSYYPVCVFAYRLLEQMWTYPLFYVPDLNPSLYTKIKNLYTGKLRRTQLKYIHDFIKLCRYADKEQQIFENIPTHLTSDPDQWAMSDFIAVKNCHLQKYILELIAKAEEHVFGCLLCTGRGFICELCSEKQIIYPWQSKVKRCDNCGSCFHQKCWNFKPDCVKCQRLKRRTCF